MPLRGSRRPPDFVAGWQVEFAELMVHTSMCLISANDTEGALHHSEALSALARVRKLSFDVYVGSNGMPPSRNTLPMIVSGSAACA